MATTPEIFSSYIKEHLQLTFFLYIYINHHLILTFNSSSWSLFSIKYNNSICVLYLLLTSFHLSSKFNFSMNFLNWQVWSSLLLGLIFNNLDYTSGCVYGDILRKVWGFFGADSSLAFVFETECHYVVLAGLALLRRQEWTETQRWYSCFCLRRAGIKGPHHHTWPILVKEGRKIHPECGWHYPTG